MPANTANFGCVGHTIRLRSGKYLDLVNPQPDQFELADIAGGLSKICRFGGQIPRYYSVAEHSIHCAHAAANLSCHVQAACLMHDAAEAFLGDCVKPLKLLLPDYRIIEARMEAVIAAKYGLDFELPDVKRIDREMLIAERRALHGKDDGVTWTGENEVARLSVDFRCWEPAAAEDRFLAAAEWLGVR